VIMQTPGQQMNQLARQSSISALVARVRARSTGAPLPFTSQLISCYELII